MSVMAPIESGGVSHRLFRPRREAPSVKSRCTEGQEPTRWGGRSRCAVRQESPRWAAGDALAGHRRRCWTTRDAAAGGKSCCAGRQEPMRRAARPMRRADRQETLLRAAGAAALGSRRVGNPRARHAQEKALGAQGAVAIAVCRAAGGAVPGGTAALGGRSRCAW